MNEQSLFAIKTDVFEGPLELLLDLIEKRKLLINDISLAAVTDEYMARVEAMQEHPLGETAQFVLIASTLLLIKSKSLLPVLSLSEDEEGSIEDLEYRLRLYQLFRNASKGVAERFGTAVLHDKTFVPHEKPIFLADNRTTLSNLHQSIREVILKLPKKHFVPKITVKTIISLEEMMARLHERIAKQFRFSFKDFAGQSAERGNVIVSFLALLELVKQGTIMVRQEAHFMDIHIERENIDTPRYT